MRRRVRRTRRIGRRRRPTRTPRTIACSDLFRVQRFSPNPRSTINAGDCWHKRTTGWHFVTTAATDTLVNMATIRSSSGTPASSNIKVRWIAVWGAIQNPLTVAFIKNVFMQAPGTSGSDSIRTYSDGGSSSDLPRVMVKIPVHLRLNTENNSQDFMTVNAFAANAVIYVRVGFSFLM